MCVFIEMGFPWLASMSDKSCPRGNTKCSFTSGIAKYSFVDILELELEHQENIQGKVEVITFYFPK